MPLREITDDEVAILDVMRGLGAGSHSILSTDPDNPGWIPLIGALHAVVAQRDAEIARLTAELASRPPPEPPPAPQPTPLPPDPPLEPEPVPPTPSEPPQPDTPTPTPPIEPEPLPPQPTPQPPIVQDLQLSPTSRALTVSLPGSFTVPSENDTLVYRKVGAPDWTKGLPLWSHGDQLTGSVFPLESDTAYEVRVTVDGVTHGGTGSTKPDVRPSHAELVGAATLTVPDTYPTLEDAIRFAPSGAVVVVADGTYERPRSAITRPLTLVSRTIGGAVIDYGPQCQSAPNRGTWEHVTLFGPGLRGAPKGEPYRVWRWTNTPATSGTRAPTNLGYSASLDEIPQRLARWATDAADLSTPAGWVEKLHTNLSYTYGWAAFPNPLGGVDLYLRMPFDADPNDSYVTAGELPTSSTGSSASLFTVAGPDVRLCGFRLRQGPVTATHQARNTVIDQNRFELAYVKLDGKKGTPCLYAEDVLIEDCTFRDTNLWTDDHQAKPVIPWDFIKGGITNADGTRYGSKIGGTAERTAIWNGGGAQRVVIRRNTIDGYFNGIGGSGSGFDRFAAGGYDIYENVIRCIADDALEPEDHASNWRIWQNRLEHVTVVLSVGPVHGGPIVLLRNEAWDIGPAGTTAANAGDPHASGPSGKGIKFSGSSLPTGRVLLLGNTWWTNQPGISGGEQSAGGGSQQEAFWLRDNLFRFTKYAFAAPGGFRWDAQGDELATTDTGRGLRVGGQKLPSTDPAWLDAQLEDPHNGNLAVRDGSPLTGKGALL